MTSTASSIDLSARPARPVLALVLALLSVPGSMLTWDTLPGGGFVWGCPLAVAAIVLGIQARRRAETGRGKALAAIVIGGAMVAIMAVWTIVGSL
jgi:hypothetical protein